MVTFYLKIMNDENKIPYRKLVLNYFDSEIYDEWTDSAQFEVYETTTTDGYGVFVAKLVEDNEIISENVHYYDHELPKIVRDVIEGSAGIYIDGEVSESIYLDDIFEEIFADNYEDILDELKDQLAEENFYAERGLGELIKLIEQEYE